MSRLPFKSEYLLRLEHGILNDDWCKPTPQPKPQQSCNESMFTPMSPDDFHLNGRLVQERESYEEQRERVAMMTKAERNANF